MPRYVRLAVLPVVLALAACGDGSEGSSPEVASAEAVTGDEVASAESIADAMLQRYEDNLGDVEAFTVVAEGAEARYTLADDTTGLDRFAPPQLAPAGDDARPERAAELLLVQVPNVARLATGLRSATLTGPISRDGRRAYAFATNDPRVVLGDDGALTADSSLAYDFRVYVDAETFDVLEINQVVNVDTLAQPVTSRYIYSDFQETDGLVLPHTVRQIQTGLNQAIPEDQRMIAGGRLGLSRQQLENQPSSPERDAQLADVIAQQRLIGEGVADLTLEVDAVRVGADAE